LFSLSSERRTIGGSDDFNLGMRTFVKKTLAFIALPLIIGIPVLVGFSVWMSQLSSEYKLNPNIKSIFIGDSHIQNAINDTTIAASINLASNSESFYFSYYKLLMLLNSNPSVEKVYLGFSYHSLSNYYDEFICGEYAAVTGPKYFYLLPVSEQLKMMYWNSDKLPSFTKTVVKEGMNKLNKPNYHSFFGGYVNEFESSSAVDSSMDKRLKFQYFAEDQERGFSAINREYLHKIVELCKSKNVTLYALNTPLHEYYDSRVPMAFKQELVSAISENQISYIDLSHLLAERFYFIPDGDHVSTSGALAVAAALNNRSSAQ
jgi:hypothetical protein